MPKSILEIYTVLIFLVIIGLTFASPQVEWEKTIGGIFDEYASSVQQTNDGGFIMAGLTGPYESGGYDAWLVKTDANGIEIWNKRYGGLLYDRAYSVLETYDGGYIFTGETDPNSGTLNDVLLVKTDKDGEKVWTKTFGGHENEKGRSVLQTADGGFVICGYTRSYGAGNWDIWLIRTNTNGDLLWSKTFGSELIDYGYFVQQTSDEGFLITGVMSSSANSYDICLIKTDDFGNKIWSKTFGGSGFDEGYFAKETLDGGIIIAGNTIVPGKLFDILLIKINAIGEELWSNTFGGIGMDMVYSAKETFDGGYILAGEMNETLFSKRKAYLIKCDADGNEIWSKSLGGNSDCNFMSVQQLKGGGYLAVGSIKSFSSEYHDSYLVKLTQDCVKKPLSDLTGDCKVDMRDLAKMAAEWLFCGQADPNDCY